MVGYFGSAQTSNNGLLFLSYPFLLRATVYRLVPVKLRVRARYVIQQRLKRSGS